ncbi:hypothetical protein [Micromonospora parathelypteridis]|uniref:Tetratricopeptide (TPR) repeat protein n=1 Tax=Micromonospora parathelypteridis TaxID=1839617 RepID=A0A840W2Z7_9ACTN|nr:hypothetical protein [Micromonospora parathelypteridis]MBB5479528.1 tetratricopeptide (TPR) repeat protein [Micromonospora parathelypteridis]GGO30408.1 hypothetical protein GCM10011576_57890 [Micromonospora parathelypteridis]
MPLAVRITLLRQLTRVDLARFGPMLAEALITRSHQVKIRRSFVLRRTAAADEAATLYRRLVRDRPGRHEVGLARALVAQGSVPDDRTMTSALEQGWEAVGYVEDTTDREGLVVLAAAHLMMANLLAPTAAQDALPLAERARATWLRCAPFGLRERTGLARSLTVLGDCRAELDAPAEALAAREEAVEIFRRLPGWARLRYMPARLLAVTGLVESLSADRRWAQALTLAATAREDLTLWARWEPLRARPTLGRLLLVIAVCHAELGEPEAAVTTAEEAVAQARWLAEHDPVRYRDWLVAALRTLAGVLHTAGRYEEAVWTADEARAVQGD